MQNPESCPKCASPNIYFDLNIWICPECSHEWVVVATELQDAAILSQASENIIKDANGNILKEGDSVTVIKDLKIKGSSSVVKVGTKIKSIRLIDAEDGHDLACRIDGIGAINLKSEFVKKS